MQKPNRLLTHGGGAFGLQNLTDFRFVGVNVVVVVAGVVDVVVAGVVVTTIGIKTSVLLWTSIRLKGLNGR